MRAPCHLDKITVNVDDKNDECDDTDDSQRDAMFFLFEFCVYRGL